MQYFLSSSSIMLVLLILLTPGNLSAIGLPAGSQLPLIIEAKYSSGAPAAEPVSLTLNILQVAQAQIDSNDKFISSTSGDIIYIPLKITNSGNGDDRFALKANSMPDWPISFVDDSNQDGIHQSSEELEVNATDTIEPDNFSYCFARVFTNRNSSGTATLTITATSLFDPGTSSSLEILIDVTPPIPHIVSFTQTPQLSTNTAMSGGVVNCFSQAEDSMGHEVNYKWSDGNAGGKFSPSDSISNPTYTAPENKTGADKKITLTCVASCFQESNICISGSCSLSVASIPGPNILSATPVNNSNFVDLNVPVEVTFDKPMNCEATNYAISFYPAIKNPTYTWSLDNKRLRIYHDDFDSSTTYACSITANAMDIDGMGLEKSYNWTFKTICLAEFEMQQISVQPGSKFYTPPIILNDPQMPDTVKLVIAIPDGVEIDTNIGSDKNLRCIQMGRDVESMSSWWNPDTREIIVDIKTGIPSQRLELISSIEMTLSPAKQSAQIMLNNRLGLSVSAINSIPGDFNKNGAIDLNDLEMFKQKWAYWHQATRSFNPISDSIFDLYPRTIEVWPNWLPIGDKKINIDDATAFTECWVGSPNTAGSYSSSIKSYSNSFQAYIWANSAPEGMFRVDFALPAKVKFVPTVNSQGNLIAVTPLNGVGNLFFSEFNPITNTIHITGNVAGKAPYYIATIRFY